MTTTDAAMSRGPALIQATLKAAIEALIPGNVPVIWGASPGLYNSARVLVHAAGAGEAKRHMGRPAGWIGNIALRAQSDTQDNAQALLDSITSGLLLVQDVEDASYAPGWTITLKSIGTLQGLPAPGMVTLGLLYRCTLLAKV